MAEALNPTELRELAAEILNENDREGRYTVPTKEPVSFPMELGQLPDSARLDVSGGRSRLA